MRALIVVSKFLYSGRVIDVLTSLFHVIIVTFFGFITSTGQSFNSFLIISLFAILSKLFAIALEESHKLSLIFVISSIITMLWFPSRFHIVVGSLVLLLYYSYFIACKVPPLDLLFHGARYALLYLLGYGFSGLSDVVAMMGIIAVFTSGVAGELISGFNRPRSTSRVLGNKLSNILSIFLVFISLIMGSLALNSVFEFPLLLNGFFYAYVYTYLNYPLGSVYNFSLKSSIEFLNSVKKEGTYSYTCYNPIDFITPLS